MKLSDIFKTKVVQVARDTFTDEWNMHRLRRQSFITGAELAFDIMGKDIAMHFGMFLAYHYKPLHKGYSEETMMFQKYRDLQNEERSKGSFAAPVYSREDVYQQFLEQYKP